MESTNIAKNAHMCDDICSISSALVANDSISGLSSFRLFDLLFFPRPGNRLCEIRVDGFLLSALKMATYMAKSSSSAAAAMKHTTPCLMSDVCGLSNVCPRTSTRRLLNATIRAAAAVAAASETSAISQSASPSPSASITCCSNSDDSICAGNVNNSHGICGGSSNIGESADDNGSCELASNVAAASTNASASSSAFKCPRCPRAYALSYTLERHMKYECGVAKQFGCFKCGKRFSRKDILKAHISNTRLHCAAAVAAAAAASAAATTTAQGASSSVASNATPEDGLRPTVSSPRNCE